MRVLLYCQHHRCLIIIGVSVVLAAIAALAPEWAPVAVHVGDVCRDAMLGEFFVRLASE